MSGDQQVLQEPEPSQLPMPDVAGPRPSADEQDALRRMVDVTARGGSAEDVLQAVAVGGSRLPGVDSTTLLRYEIDGSTVIVASDGATSDVVVGMRAAGPGDGATQRSWPTNQAARLDDVSPVGSGQALEER